MIGIFDSGVGGLSVFKEVTRLLPNTSIIYIADQAYLPYGDLSPSLISHRGHTLTRFLSSLNVKLVVVACNTATLNTPISSLRQHFPSLKFIGIEPPIKPLASLTQTGHTALVATPASCRSSHLKALIKTYAGAVKIDLIPSPDWAMIVESNPLDSPQTTSSLRRTLTPLLNSNIDYLGLGSTHYSFLIPQINRILSGEIKVINTSLPVARQVKLQYELLQSKSPVKKPTYRFISTQKNNHFSQSLFNLLKLEKKVEYIPI